MEEDRVQNIIHVALCFTNGTENIRLFFFKWFNHGALPTSVFGLSGSGAWKTIISSFWFMSEDTDIILKKNVKF